ncbi:MAG: alpha/beta fold hydrolase [Hyphomicrobiaceae bacterium]
MQTKTTAVEALHDVRALESLSDRLETPCGHGAMVWRRWPAAAAGSERARRTVILLHGGSGSWTHWVRVIPLLRADRDVWAADLPGLGESAMPAGEPTPQSAAEAVAAGLRELIPHAARADLVGFSFGAHVGTYAAGLLGGHIASFTIVGTSALGIPRPPLEEFPKEHSTMREPERRAVHRRVLEILMFHRRERIDDLAITLQQQNVAQARFKSRKFAATDGVARGLEDVIVPVRAVWGRQDVIAHPNVEACLDVIRRSHPELVAEIVEDAGHWVMYERPTEFAAALQRVLAG